MSSLFSRIDRNLSMVKRPFMVFRLSLAPDEAVARCVAHWRTFKIRSETPGMREQFALTGWVGTELVIGNNEGIPCRHDRHVKRDPCRRRTVSESDT